MGAVDTTLMDLGGDVAQWGSNTPPNFEFNGVFSDLFELTVGLARPAKQTFVLYAGHNKCGGYFLTLIIPIIQY